MNAVYCVHLLYNFCIRKIITYPAELLIILAYSHLLCLVACTVLYSVQFAVAAFSPNLYENSLTGLYASKIPSGQIGSA
jgi:hypothetical protein